MRRKGIAWSVKNRYNIFMKKILVGFLTLSCVLLSFSARLPLTHHIYDDKTSGISNSAQNRIRIFNGNGFLHTELSTKDKYFRRFFGFIHGYFIPRAGTVIHSWVFVGRLAYLTASFLPVYLFSAHPRSPPGKLCF